MRTLALSVLLAVPSFATPARADDSVRCGDRLVSAGAVQGEVQAKCGPPTYAYTAYTADAIIDRWSYDRGPHDFIRTLVFRNGVLAHVVVGSYGN
jgi:hypothetical protein